MICDTDPSLLPPLSASAWFSPCRRYRYGLERTWDPTRKPLCWLMLNPSTADAFALDHTIRRCIGFARAWGHGGVRVANLFAYRATNPADMRAESHPVAAPDAEYGGLIGENLNDGWITRMSDGHRLIAAWGCHGTHLGRDQQVMQYLARRAVECLGVTADGHSRHPLYVHGATVPVPFRPREVHHA